MFLFIQLKNKNYFFRFPSWFCELNSGPRVLDKCSVTNLLSHHKIYLLEGAKWLAVVHYSQNIECRDKFTSLIKLLTPSSVEVLSTLYCTNSKGIFSLKNVLRVLKNYIQEETILPVRICIGFDFGPSECWRMRIHNLCIKDMS